VTFYQLGAVLHDLIMRRPLFHAEKPYAKLVNAVQHVVPRILADNVQTELVLLARKCLIKDWRKRLECVSWTDFFNLGIKYDVDALKDQICKNKVASQALQAAGIDAGSTPEMLLQEVSDSLILLCRRIRNKNKGVLPPLETVTIKACSLDCKHVVLNFTPSESCGLSAHLSIFLTVEILTQKEKAVSIGACGKVSMGKEYTAPCTECKNTERVYVGVYDVTHVEAQEVIITEKVESGAEFFSSFIHGCWGGEQ